MFMARRLKAFPLPYEAHFVAARAAVDVFAVVVRQKRKVAVVAFVELLLGDGPVPRLERIDSRNQRRVRTMTICRDILRRDAPGLSVSSDGALLLVASAGNCRTLSGLGLKIIRREASPWRPSLGNA
jgi:hypothetical protein